MEDARYFDCLAFVLDQNYVGESVDHRCPKLLMYACKRVGSIGDRFKTITHRSSKTISKINGDAVVVLDGGSDSNRCRSVEHGFIGCDIMAT